MNDRAEPSARDVAGFAAMTLGMFIAILDIQIVAASLNQIQAGLAASIEETSWIQTSYLIAEVVAIPLSGYLTRVFSTRALFAASAGAFTLSSLLCAAAWNLDSMIVFRVFQGFSGAFMIPLSFSAALVLWPGQEKQTRIQVLIGLVVMVAPAIGPSLGGWITHSLSWHWIFLINAPIGIAVTVAVMKLVDIDRPEHGLLRRIDIAGIGLMALFLGSVQYVLEEGPRKDWLDDAHILTAGACGAIAGIFFFARALTARHPVVSLSAFRDRNFVLGCFFSFVIGVGMYGSVYVQPLFLATIRDYDSLQIGTVMAVLGGALLISAPIAGELAKRMDLRLLLAAGLALFAWGCWLNAHTTGDWGFAELFWPQVLRGFGLTFCFLSVTVIAFGTLEERLVQDASGIYNLMRNLGGAFGLAGINTVFIERNSTHWAHLREAVSPFNDTAAEIARHAEQELWAAGISDPQTAALEIFSRLAQREALVMSFNDIFVWMTGAYVIALLLLIFARRPANNTASAH